MPAIARSAAAIALFSGSRVPVRCRVGQHLGAELGRRGGRDVVGSDDGDRAHAIAPAPRR